MLNFINLILNDSRYAYVIYSIVDVRMDFKWLIGIKEKYFIILS